MFRYTKFGLDGEGLLGPSTNHELDPIVFTKLTGRSIIYTFLRKCLFICSKFIELFQFRCDVLEHWSLWILDVRG